MDRLEALRLFVLAIDHGGLSAGARAAGRSAAFATRAVDALEARVGTTLVRRTTRSLKLTAAGARYLEVARRVLGELDAAERVTGAEEAAPHGVLEVTAPVAFGTLHVLPVVDAYLAAHPAARARLLLVDRVVSLPEEGLDVAVRIGRLPDSALRAVACGAVRRVCVASPGYLARHGRPRTPADLARHRAVVAAQLVGEDVWSFAGARERRTQRVKVDTVLRVNVVDAAIRSAVAGVGVTCALSYQVAHELAAGTLVRLLPAYEPPALPVHVVTLEAGARSAKVRAFVELAVPRLRAALA